MASHQELNSTINHLLKSFALLALVSITIGSPIKVLAQPEITSIQKVQLLPKETVNQRLKHVLASKDLRPIPQSNSLKLWAWLVKQYLKIARWISGLFGDKSGNLLAGKIVENTVMILLSVLACALAIIGIIKFRKGRILKVVQKDSLNDNIELFDETITAHGWFQLSEELFRSGKYREAYRSAFIACLLQLDNLKLIKFERQRTNGEYLRKLNISNNKYLYDKLENMTYIFDISWYGHHPVNSNHFNLAADFYNELVKLKPLENLETAV